MGDLSPRTLFLNLLSGGIFMGQLSSKLVNVDRGKIYSLGIDQAGIDLIPIKSYSVQLENELEFISLRAQ